MIKMIKKYWHKIIWYSNKKLVDLVCNLGSKVEFYRREIQSLCGRIKLLEEQHDIMHNFLVEINKYLVNLSTNKMEKKDGLRVNETKAKSKKANERGKH